MCVIYSQWYIYNKLSYSLVEIMTLFCWKEREERKQPLRGSRNMLWIQNCKTKLSRVCLLFRPGVIQEIHCLCSACVPSHTYSSNYWQFLKSHYKQLYSNLSVVKIWIQFLGARTFIWHLSKWWFYTYSIDWGTMNYKRKSI